MAQDSSRNLVAALSYFMGFITGVVILLVEHDDRFVRFHAMQSTIIFGGLFIVNIVIGIIFSNLSFLGFIGSFINILISLAALFVWLFSMYQAYQGKMFKWQYAGEWAENKVR